jgi:hypothetical protein
LFIENLIWHLFFLFPVTFLVLLLSANVISQEIKFNFNPPDELTFHQTLKTTKITDKSAAVKRTEISKAYAKIEMKGTPTGYTFTVTPVSLNMSID